VDNNALFGEKSFKTLLNLGLSKRKPVMNESLTEWNTTSPTASFGIKS